jgi:tetratricopeptide (TPR) repeat protein
MSMLLLKRGKTDEAAILLQPLYARGERGDVAVLLSETERIKGKTAEADKILSDAFVNGSSALAEYVRANGFRDRGQTEEVTAAYQRAIALDPGFVPARLDLTLARLAAGDLATAKPELEAMAKNADHDPHVLLPAAELAIDFGNHVRATELLDRVSASKDANAFAWRIERERGRMLFREGQIDGAVRALERAKKLKPDDEKTLLLLVQTYSQQGTAAAVEAALAAMRTAHPDRSATYLAEAQARILGGRAPEARAFLARAEALAASEKASPLWLAELDFWQGRALENDNPSRAAFYFDRALQKNPSHAGAHYHRGNLFFDSGDNEKAVASYQKAIDLDPRGYPKAYFFLGTILVDMVQVPPAKAALSKFIELAPGDVDAEEAKQLLQNL